MSFLNIVYLTTIAVVSTIKVCRNNIADGKISKMGYSFKDDRPFKEKLVSFLRDYSYLLVPFIHLYVPYRESLIDADEYLDERIKQLNYYGVLSKEEDIKPEKKTEIEVKSEEKKEETKKEEKKELKIEDLSLEEQISYYERLENNYRIEHEKLTKAKADVNLRNELVKKVIDIDRKLDSLHRQLKIKKLTEERDRITSSRMIK